MQKKLFISMILLIILFPINAEASGTYREELDRLLKEYPLEQEELEINILTKEVLINGEKGSLSEEFNISDKQEDLILNDPAYINERLKVFGYEKEDSQNGIATYINKFATKRLIVMDAMPSNTYGSIEEIEKPNEFYVLQYKSEEETKEAYENLVKDNYDVRIDAVIKNSLAYLPKRTSSYDNGVDIMGLDLMQANDDYKKYNVVVAVLDTGYTESNIGTGRVIKAKDFTSDHDTADVLDHGNRVCQIIVDSTNDNVKVMPLKVFDNYKDTSVLIIENALQYSINNNADVINMSLGMDDKDNPDISKSVTVWNSSIDEAIRKNIPVIVSAGNEGHHTDYNYPAYYLPCWTIGAVTDAKKKASFSNYGDIDFVAPGSSIAGFNISGDHSTASGTSFSVPYISAFAAQLKAGIKFNSVNDEYNCIKDYCEDLGDTGYDQMYGYGLPVYTKVCTEHNYEIYLMDSGTCVRKRHTIYKCSNCGDRYEDYGDYDLNNHAHQRMKVKRPTCTSEGVECMVCEDCGVEVSSLIVEQALGHEYALTGTVESTCSQNGYDVYECSRCHDIKHDSIPLNLNNHSNLKTENKNATCLETGYSKIVCKDCGTEISSESFNALGHDYIQKINSEATCKAKGEKTLICNRCNDEIIEYTEVNPNNHNNIKKYHVDSTCISDGYDKEICEDCGTIINQSTINKTGHNYELEQKVDSSCKSNGYDRYICSYCGDIQNNIKPYVEHEWETITQPPTMTDDGYTGEICCNCGEERNKLYIPSQQVRVVRVVDGDTIVVESAAGKQYKVRMIGINTPESVSLDTSKNTPEGTIASEYTKSILEHGMTVYLEYDQTYFDKYGRILAYPWMENCEKTYDNFKKYNIGALILQNTYCESVYYSPNGKYKDWYDDLESLYQPFIENVPAEHESTENSSNENSNDNNRDDEQDMNSGSNNQSSSEQSGTDDNLQQQNPYDENKENTSEDINDSLKENNTENNPGEKTENTEETKINSQSRLTEKNKKETKELTDRFFEGTLKGNIENVSIGDDIVIPQYTIITAIPKEYTINGITGMSNVKRYLNDMYEKANQKMKLNVVGIYTFELPNGCTICFRVVEKIKDDSDTMINVTITSESKTSYETQIEKKKIDVVEEKNQTATLSTQQDAELRNTNTTSVATLSIVKNVKLKNKKNKKLVISYKKINGVRYQIQYSKNKKFKKAKTINTIKNKYIITKLQKKKTYYIRVRTYLLQADGSYLYSKWSKVKKIKIKK